MGTKIGQKLMLRPIHKFYKKISKYVAKKTFENQLSVGQKKNFCEYGLKINSLNSCNSCSANSLGEYLYYYSYFTCIFLLACSSCMCLISIARIKYKTPDIAWFGFELNARCYFGLVKRKCKWYNYICSLLYITFKFMIIPSHVNYFEGWKFVSELFNVSWFNLY